MLDTGFERVAGDIGNPTSFDFPVLYHVVPNATVTRIVGAAQAARALLPGFVAGARVLESAGAGAIVTSCGFLSVVQADLAAAVRVPVAASTLSLWPLVAATVGGRPVGIVTARAASLSPDHLRAAGIPTDRAILRGMEVSPAFGDAIMHQRAAVDPRRIRAEVVQVCTDMARDHPDMGAILFECTNLQPYAAAVQQATGLAVFSIHHLVTMLSQAVNPPVFSDAPINAPGG